MKNTVERMIIAGVDCTDRSLAAVETAAAEAQRRRARLVLLTAHPATGGCGPHVTLTAMLRRVCATWPAVAVTARNVTGDPARALVDASRDAELVVVGRHEDQPADDLGSVSSQVAAHALCPTMVVPGGATSTEGRVLLGLGMSPDDTAAIAVAFEEASQRQEGLMALQVWSGIPAAPVGAVSPFAYDLRQAHAAADRMISEAIAGWAEKYPDVVVERMPLYDVNPATTLADASSMAGLVVISARRNSHRSSQLLGTVTRHLLEHSRCPVLVVRPNHG